MAEGQAAPPEPQPAAAPNPPAPEPPPADTSWATTQAIREASPADFARKPGD